MEPQKREKAGSTDTYGTRSVQQRDSATMCAARNGTITRAHGAAQTAICASAGKLQISKKELNRYVNTAEKLLLLYLHGFMQEQKELEAEKG